MSVFGEDRVSGKEVSAAEETLRTIARLPAPEGLAQRVQARLPAAPQRKARFWRVSGAGFSGWMHSAPLRGLAAACLVAAVTVGGWQVWVHVQPAASPSAIIAPARLGNQGGFSSAGAMRRPDTLNGPVITHQAQQPNAKTGTSAPAVETKSSAKSPKKAAKKAAPDLRLPVR